MPADDYRVRMELRSADTRSEGMRLESATHHLGSGDSAKPLEDYGNRVSNLWKIAAALGALFVIVTLVVLMVL
jgi:hypothetical protein